MKIKGYLACLMMIGLSGCAATMKNKFDCPSAPGVRCKSINEINELVDREIVSGANFSQWSDRTGRTRTVNPSSKEIFSVWVAPYEDRDGIFHKSAVLTSVTNLDKSEIS